MLYKLLSGALAAALLSFSLAWAESHSPNPEDLIVAKLAQQFADRKVGGNILFWDKEQRRIGFKNLRHIYPSRTVEAAAPYPLGARPLDLGQVQYTVDGESFTVGDFMAQDSSIGLLVVQGGDIVTEYYAPGNDESSLWVSFSVTKSVSSMLIGAAIADGYIESVEESVVDYLPRLRGSAYEQASIADVLHMASGVAWNEDYADPGSDVALAGALNGPELVAYLGNLPRKHQPGEVFNYNTGETNLVGEILRSAIGNNAATYLSSKIWTPYGMEFDASWALGAPMAGELGGCCISASLRDYARIGLFALSDGVLPDGSRVLPEGWMARSAAPSQGDEGYGYLWWLYGDRAYGARGIFGQQIRIDPKRDLVIALHSNAPAAVGSIYHEHIDAALAAIENHFPMLAP
ncbi:MAG: serine hydrolase domain-containing protein [Pseudomonadota bacterium]